MECATPMRPPTSPEAEAPDYQPSPQERSTLETYLQRISEHAPRMKVGEAADLAPDHPEPAVGLVLLMAALGTADHDFYGGLVRQLGEACAQDGAVDESALNFMLSVVKGIKPRDQVEAMLAAQMAAVHMATLACARPLARADAPSDGAERALNRLSRTYRPDGRACALPRRRRARREPAGTASGRGRRSNLGRRDAGSACRSLGRRGHPR